MKRNIDTVAKAAAEYKMNYHRRFPFRVSPSGFECESLYISQVVIIGWLSNPNLDQRTRYEIIKRDDKGNNRVVCTIERKTL